MSATTIERPHGTGPVPSPAEFAEINAATSAAFSVVQAGVEDVIFRLERGLEGPAPSLETAGFALIGATWSLASDVDTWAKELDQLYAKLRAVLYSLDDSRPR